MATIALSLNQAGGVQQIIPFSVKLSDFTLVETDPINDPGQGDYKVTILPNIGSKYMVTKMVIKTSDDLILQDGYKTIRAMCPGGLVGVAMDGLLANSSKISVATEAIGSSGIGFSLLDGELSLKNGDTYGNASVTSLVDATLSGYIDITKEA